MLGFTERLEKVWMFIFGVILALGGSIGFVVTTFIATRADGIIALGWSVFALLCGAAIMRGVYELFTYGVWQDNHAQNGGER